MENEKRRTELYSLLGPLPSRQKPVTSRMIMKEEKNNYFIETLLLDLNEIEPVPALFVSPKNAAGKTPVVLFNHAYGHDLNSAKQQLINPPPFLMNRSYAEELTGQGYSALCIDALSFGERSNRGEGEIFKDMLLKGEVMWGHMIYDNIRAVDYLFTRDDIDTTRIATLGMSMGGTLSWWTASLDTRVKVCVDLCSLSDLDCLIETGGIDLHSVYYFVPGLLKHFTTADIISLICPRPHLSLNGIHDKVTPVKGLEIINEELNKLYKEYGAEDRFKLKKYPVAHYETPEMRMDVMEFLRKWL